MTDTSNPASDPAAGSPAEKAQVWSCRGVKFVSARYVAHKYCPHFHDEYSIGVIVSGVLGFRRGKAEFEAASGVISAINPGEVHTGCAESPGGWTARNMLVGMDELLPEAFGGSGEMEPVFQAPIIEDMSVAERLLEAHRLTGQACSRFEKESALIAALGGLFLRHAPARSKPRGLGHPGARRAAEYVQDNYAEDISLGEVARASGLSKFHFLRTFTQEMDITPHAYLIQIRVREAMRLLRAGHSISDAAAMAGFADQSHFTRCFKRTMGVPPHLFLQAA